jgi:hypothetical protein
VEFLQRYSKLDNEQIIKHMLQVCFAGLGKNPNIPS